MSDFFRLIDLCRGRRVYIQTHDVPDPDAIASAFGLQRLLAAYEVPSTLCYHGGIDKLSSSKMLETFGIELLPWERLRGEMAPEDLIVCVDTQKDGGHITDLPGEEEACIDHHPLCAPLAYRYHDIRTAGACASIIAEYYQTLGRQPDRDAATALLYGIKMDTLQFTRGVTGLDIRMFAFLHPLCDQDKLAHMERNNMEYRDLRAYGAAIESIRLFGEVGFSGLPFSCPDAMIAILADFILSLVEVEVAVVFSYREDGIKFSVRSEDPAIRAGELVAAALAGAGGGGGHDGMAGGLVRRGDLPRLGEDPEGEIRRRFLRALEQMKRG